MKSRYCITLLFLGLLAGYFAFAQTGVSTGAGDKQKNFVTDHIEIRGLVSHPGVLTADSLRKMAIYERKDIKITSIKGDLKKRFAVVKGVLLTDIIRAAGLQMPNPKEKGKYYIRLTAADGYTVLYSYNELFFSMSGPNTLVLFEEDGLSIKEDGLFVAICLSDNITGPRHVKWLQTIEVGKLD